MDEMQGRLWVKLISKDALAQYMKFRGFTVRTLAAAVDRENAKHGHHTRSRAIVGHLRSGKRNTCQPWTALAVERCLEAPSGSLFVPHLSYVSRPHKTAA